jgi:hypothetical protein
LDVPEENDKMKIHAQGSLKEVLLENVEGKEVNQSVLLSKVWLNGSFILILQDQSVSYVPSVKKGFPMSTPRPFWLPCSSGTM